MPTMQNISLDDAQIYKRVDSDHMLQHLHEFPGECKKAYEKAINSSLLKDICEFNKIVILGMGGSAIGGDLVNSLAISQAKIPLIIYRGYKLPEFIDKHTLVISSSYSGNTEETLACFKRSIELGAQNLVITTGGKLKNLAEKHHIPVFLYDYKSPPRAALPYSLIPLLIFMEKLHVISDIQTDLLTTIDILEKQGNLLKENIIEKQNRAKSLARSLYNKIPIIYGVETIGEVAHRWKTQINENSKSMAFYEIFPELNHNAVVGYEFPEKIRNTIFVIILNSAFVSSQLKIRSRATENILSEAGIKYENIDGPKNNKIAEMIGLILLGDYVSYYLAILNKVAPSPVKAIDYLKSELSKYNEAQSV